VNYARHPNNEKALADWVDAVAVTQVLHFAIKHRNAAPRPRSNQPSPPK
jgi:hypothetical protein